MPLSAGHRPTGAQGARFLAFGALNTLATYALYCVLVALIAPQAAYAIVFALGIGLAYVLNSRYVFATPIRAGTAALYPLVYAAQYGANALLIDVFIGAGLGPRAALAVALVIVTPLSFVLNHLVLTRNRGTHEP
jgi:putative flippase GtrA